MRTMRIGRVHRVLLALVGLLLLAGGGSVLAVGLGVRPPFRWLHTGPHDVLLSTAERTHWRGTGWWWPVVIAALAVLLLLALWWLLAALRRRRPWPTSPVRPWRTHASRRASRRSPPRYGWGRSGTARSGSPEGRPQNPCRIPPSTGSMIPVR